MKEGLAIKKIFVFKTMFPGIYMIQITQKQEHLLIVFLITGNSVWLQMRILKVADAVCFLVSERAAFITGANVVVDGGQTKKII